MTVFTNISPACPPQTTVFFFFCVGRGKCYYACPVTRITGLSGSRSDVVAITTKNSSSFFLRLEGRQPR